MKRAGDVLTDMRRKRIVVRHQGRKVDAPVGEGREIGPASDGTRSMSAATARSDLFAGVKRLRRRRRSGYLTGKVTPVMARTFSCATTSTARRKPCMKRLRSRSCPVKLNSTQGGVPASPLTSETRPRAIGLSSVGARLATRGGFMVAEQDTRLRILAAAKGVLMDAGDANLSTRGIAEAAGCR